MLGRCRLRDNATVVLVHGAWHSAGCWEHVVAGLAEHGVTSVAVDLPTCDECLDGGATLSDDAAIVRKTIMSIDGDVVVVGHSYGGAVITEGAAECANVRRLVYLAAFMPDAGESVAGLIASAGGADVLAALRTDDAGRSYIEPDQMRALFYGDCDDAAYARAAAHLRTMALDASSSPARVAWREVRSTFVIAADDRAVPPALQRRFASRRATESVEWRTSHSPFASRPELVVDLLAGLATGWAGGSTR